MRARLAKAEFDEAKDHQLWICTEAPHIVALREHDWGWFLTGDKVGFQDGVEWDDFIPFYGQVILEEHP
jgi:hypothetical protein